MADNNHNTNILKVTTSEKYHTVEELFSRSEPGSFYYTLLVLSVFIISAGLLLENSAIVIGGMLVTPVLTPILLIALGINVGQPKVITGVLSLMLKSFLLIIAVSLAMAFIFGVHENSYIFENTMRTAVLYFIVAVSSGILATFAMARKEMSETLPGIAIAVSLVPPLALVGIRLAGLDGDAARFYFLVFLFNLFGIIMGSLVVFSLLKFYKIEEKVKKEHEVSEENHEKEKSQ